MKLLVQTTGDFALYDLAARQVIAAHRPTVVTNTAFIQNHRGTKLQVLDTLADSASDAALADATDLEAAIKALPRAPAPEPKKPHHKPKD